MKLSCTWLASFFLCTSAFAQAIATEPTLQASNLVFSNITPTSLTIDFTNGNGSSRIVLMRQGNSVTANPIDGVSYSANASFGSGSEIGTGNFVVGAGNGPITITNLLPATPYYFKVFEFNGAPGTENYNINASQDNPFFAATFANEPTAQPTLFNFPIVSSTSIRGSYVASSPSVSGYIVLRKEGAVPTETPVDGSIYLRGEALGSSTVAYAGTSTIFDDGGLSPETSYYYAVYAYNGADASTNYLTTSALIAFVTTPPLVPFEIGVPTFDKAFMVDNKVTVDINGGSGALTVLFYYRGITQHEWSSTVASLKQGTTKTFEVSLTEAMTDELGIEFYFTANDGIELVKSLDANNYFIYRTLTDDANQVIPFTAGFNGSSRESQMFSVPYDLDPNTVEDVFDELGAYDIKKWRVFHFEGEYQEYKDGFNNIEIGKGYWLNAKNDLGVQIKPGKGEVTNYNQSSSFPMSLKQGWNQIGNPFPFIIDWTKVVGIDKTGPLSFYHDGAYDENQTTFGPWRGAFIHADEAVTLLIPVSAKASSSGRSTAVDESKPELDSDDWLVPIHVTIEGMQQNSGVGMNPKASASKDRFDRIAVPHFIDFAEMTTEHNEFFSPHFSRDVMPSISEYTWSFTVKSNLDNGQGQLAWDNQSIAHNSSSLVLIDRTESRWVDMKSQGSYSFTHHGERQIEIVYDRDGEINPGMTLLGDAYPNPFATTVTIPILVDEPGLQQIEFFDGLGRKVTQYTRWFETSGIHEFNCNWSEQSNVSAGLMYYKLTGTSSVKRLIKH